jgi:hypothetical protein
MNRRTPVFIGSLLALCAGAAGALAAETDRPAPSAVRGSQYPLLHADGTVNFEEIIRALNDVKYHGPLSVEWEDSGMEREFGAREACGFVRSKDFAPSGRAFDAAFEKA